MSFTSDISFSLSKVRSDFWHSQEGISPLVTFRVLFGLVVAFGAVRFMMEGWIETLLVEPNFFFSFWGFEWIPRPNRVGAYALYGAITASALAVSLGYRYRWSVVILLISFTYAELLDATNYLNHYYLVILLAGLLLFTPAHRAFSLDVWSGRIAEQRQVPKWHRHVLMLQLAIVYFFAGLAKVNSDWLFEAMPMAIWLPERADYPLVGQLFEQPWVAYAFSWAGCLYDLTIVLWLLWKPTRKWAYLAVIVFHLMTWWLFNIGLFPLIMMSSTLLFFSPLQQESFLMKLRSWGQTFWNKIDRQLEQLVLWNSNPEVAVTGVGVSYGVRKRLLYQPTGFLRMLCGGDGARCPEHATLFTQASEKISRPASSARCPEHATLSLEASEKISRPATSARCPEHATLYTQASEKISRPASSARCPEHATLYTQASEKNEHSRKKQPYSQWLEISKTKLIPPPHSYATTHRNNGITALLSLYFLIQIALPLRTILYPGPAAWGEEGYRFGWRVMLVEKSGDAIFTVIDANSGRRTQVNNLDYLTPYQEKQMAIQPDFILQFAQHLAYQYSAYYGFENPIVNVESFVALNGRRSRRLIDPSVNLALEENGLSPKPWILPFEQ